MQPTVVVRVNVSVAWVDGTVRVRGAGRAHTISGFPPTGNKLRDAATLLRLAAEKLDEVRGQDTS